MACSVMMFPRIGGRCSSLTAIRLRGAVRLARSGPNWIARRQLGWFTAVHLTGKARLAGLVGWPVSHSRSPGLHGHWFERYGIDGTYVPLPVRPEDVELAFRALPRLGFLGWNVTVPHKEAACRLVDELDPMAARIGAVNTVLVQPDGRTRGLNSDGLGLPRQSAPAGARLAAGAGFGPGARCRRRRASGSRDAAGGRRPGAATGQSNRGASGGFGRRAGGHWPGGGGRLGGCRRCAARHGPAGQLHQPGHDGPAAARDPLGRAAAIGRRRRSGLCATGDRSAGRARVVAATSRSRVWGCCCIRRRPASPTGAASCPRSTSGSARRCWLPARRIVPAGR